MMKSKIFIVGLISLMMVAGLVLSCKDKDDCCTAADWERWQTQLDVNPTNLSGIPQCCIDIALALDAGSEDLGCCAVALN
jgi:hypothetical protein